MGKREVGELSVLDLVVFLMIAELAVVSIEKRNEPMLFHILPMIVLLFMQIIFSIIFLKSKKIRDFVEGQPTVLISNGTIHYHEMKKQRYNLDDLFTQLREQNIASAADVEFAILEPTGKLSVIEKQDKNTSLLTPFPIIMDGEIQYDELERIQKSELWLRGRLRKLGYHSKDDILVCMVKDDYTLEVKEKR